MQSVEDTLSKARALLIQRHKVAEQLAAIDRQLENLLEVSPTETHKPKRKVMSNDQFLTLALGGMKNERVTKGRRTLHSQIQARREVEAACVS